MTTGCFIMNRETQTVRLMIELYCRDHHGGESPCEVCGELVDYAEKRIAGCPFGKAKPACSDCRIHCFKPEMRTRIRDVMCYAGPRMAWRHPLLSLDHLRRKLRPRL